MQRPPDGGGRLPDDAQRGDSRQPPEDGVSNHQPEDGKRSNPNPRRSSSQAGSLDGRASALAVAVLVIATSVLVGSAAAAAIPVGQALVVTDASSGDRLLAVPVENGSTVTVSYTHSVERTPVRDVYAVDGQRLTMTRMEFSSYGYGLPARAEVEQVDGQFVTYPDWSGQTLSVKPGHIAGHELVVDGRRYNLVRLADANTVEISVVDVSLLDRLLGRTDSTRPGATTSEDP